METLFDRFKTAVKKPCGTRAEAISLGKFIVEKFRGDELNKDVVDYVKKSLEFLEKDEKTCSEAPGCSAYELKNWKEYFAVSKEIIKNEGNSPLALDVMLTLVSVGYDRTTVDNVDTFNSDTLYYAKQAILRIEAGQKSQTGNWGVFEPFKTKENALGWMNYIIGWISYYKLNQKKEALGYFYKSMLYEGDNQKKRQTYEVMGNYYFDEAARLDTEYRDKYKANNYQETDESRTLLALSRASAERAIEAFGRAYKIAVEKREKREVIDRLYRNITDLYKFLFNLAAPKKSEVDEYFEKLIRRPMFDPATPVKAILMKR